MWHSRRTRTLTATVAVLTVVAALVAIVLVSHQHNGPSAIPPATAPLRTSGAPATQPGALAVKIDNVSGARPQTGLSAAQVIYVEPVEAGLTRLVAMFTGPLPATVGPVRSARETDLGLLAAWGHPVLAYSGAVPELVKRLHATRWLVSASDADTPRAYRRSDSRHAPHNLYVSPRLLPKGTGPAQPVVDVGAAPAGGTPTTDLRVRFTAARYDFRWSTATGRWLVFLDGSPLTTTESGGLGAATVVVQHVHTVPGTYREDRSGNRAPIAQTVGSGSVTVLRDGLAFTGTWTRPTATDPTRFRTMDGADLPLAADPAWIVLAV